MIQKWILSSCFLILVVLAVRAILGNKISARCRYMLWVLVLVRLLVPVQLFTFPANSIPVISNAMEQMQEKPVHIFPVQPVPMETGDIISDANSFHELPKPESTAERNVRNTYANKISPVEVMYLLWAIGGSALALIVLESNLRFSVCLRRIRRHLEGIESQIPVYLAEGLPSPCLFGVLKPAVYLTEKTVETPEMLRHVLAHELTHYRHLDHIWSILRGIALAVHWWNPLVWLAVLLSCRDGELACDEGALKQLGREERITYGETLLALVTVKPGLRNLLSCATTMSGETRSLQERIRRIACEPKQFAGAVMAVVMIAALTSACAFGKPAEMEPPIAPQQQQTGEAEPARGYEQPVLPSGRKEGVYTFLLAGIDAGSGNTDTLMVVSYDTVNQDMSIMSIPRDTAVNDSQGINRLGYVYTTSSGSMDTLKERVGKLIGFTPDYYVKANLSICSQLVDILGGVLFDVPQDMDYDDPYQNLYIHLQKGPQMLNGEQAMGLVRFRRYSEGDVKRVAVQQDFIKVLIEECLSLKNWNKVTEYINLVLENVETDLEPASTAWFAANMLGLNDGVPALSLDDVYTCTIPGDYWVSMMSSQYQYRLSVVVSYPDQVAELVNERFNPYKQDITVSMLDEVVIPQETD